MKKIIYFSPHVLTLMGLGCAVQALMALLNNRIDEAVRFSLLVLVVDRLDGTLARKLNVREKFPSTSGEILDIVTDLIGLTFVPMMLFWQTGLFVEKLGTLLVVLAPMTASWKYARKESFLKDGFSVGAPPIFFSVFLFYFLQLPPIYPTVYTAALIVLTVSPVKYPITNLVTTHWKPGYKSLTNYLTALALVPVFILLQNTPPVILWVVLAALCVQLVIDPILLHLHIIKPVFDREY